MKNLKSTLDVAALRAPMQETHDSGVNLTIAWRRKQLLTLKQMLTTHKKEFQEALYKDLGKHYTEASCTELVTLEGEIDYFIANLSKLMQSKQVPSPAVLLPAFSTLEPRPLCGPGCLVIGPSNYPVLLSLKPVAGSLAAGNPTVLKPSELSSAVSQLLHRLVTQYFDTAAFRVVQGGVSETNALLKESWGLVFFTGSSRVGKIVAACAAETLTPVVLELGGKSPCFVDETAPSDLQAVANRIIWGKTLNAGQTCVAVDTLIVHESVIEKLVPELLQTLYKQFGLDPAQGELGRMVQPLHAVRQVEMIQQVEKAAACAGSLTKIVSGGSATCDPRSGYVCPTIVLNPPRDCRLLQEEIFGPILPIVTVKSRDEAVQVMRDLPGTPLCLYVFTKSAKIFKEITQKCPSGSAVRNDAVLHLVSPHFPFGGLGSSGYGAYHGKYSFDTFSHLHFSLYRPCSPGMDLGMARYHPFGDYKGYFLEQVVKLPDVPVLHVRGWLVLFMALAACRYVPFLQGLVKEAAFAVATRLAQAAAFLRRAN